MKQSGQIPSLDGLRAFSILLVLVGHAGISAKIPGGFGVTVFFFLSGYLITTLMLREQARTGTVALGRFYMRRVVRLGPPLLLTLLGAAVLVSAGLAGGVLDPATVLSQVFFVFNYYSLTGSAHWIDGLGILWSLSVEEHFYLIWPLLFIGWARGHVRNWHLVALTVAILLWRCYRVLAWGSDEWTVYISTDTRFDSILFGCLLAMWQARPDGAGLPRNPDRLMYLLLGAAVLTLLFTFAYRDPLFRSTLRYSLQGLALAPIFHYAVTRPNAWMFRPLNWRVSRRIGVWSYTIYLCHFVILKALEAGGVVAAGSWALAVAALGLSCLWAALVYELAEKPFHPLRRRLSQVPA